MPATLPAAVLVVQHFAPDSDGQYLLDRFARHTSLDCRLSIRSEPLRASALYLPPPTATCWPKAAANPTCW